MFVQQNERGFLWNKYVITMTSSATNIKPFTKCFIHNLVLIIGDAIVTMNLFN